MNFVFFTIRLFIHFYSFVFVLAYRLNRLGYHVNSNKVRHLMFDNNFDKCGTIFKIISLVDS